jgi:hypothetical protein
MTVQELDANERLPFLVWRRNLARFALLITLLLHWHLCEIREPVSELYDAPLLDMIPKLLGYLRALLSQVFILDNLKAGT